MIREIERKLGVSVEELMELDGNDLLVTPAEENTLEEVTEPPSTPARDYEKEFYDQLQETGIKYTQYYYTLARHTERNTVTIAKEEQTGIEYPCKLLLDQSTSTGYAVYDSYNQLVTSGELIKKTNTSVGRYKHVLSLLLHYFIEKYQVKEVLYEEVYDEANYFTTEVLQYLKHMIRDIEVENEIHNRGRAVKVYGVDHRIWKKGLAQPDTFKAKKGKDKEEVRKYVELMYPLLFIGRNKSKMREDMVDAIGMGIGMYVKETASGKMYNKVRYEKNLPLDEKLYIGEYPILQTYVAKGGDYDKLSPEEKEELNYFVTKQRKPFRDAYDVRGMEVIDIPNNRQYREMVRRYLTYTDCISVAEITPNHREWGLLLLEHNICLKDYDTEPTFYIVGARRRRRI